MSWLSWAAVVFIGASFPVLLALQARSDHHYWKEGETDEQ